MSTLRIRRIDDYMDYPVKLLEPLRQRKIEACRLETKKAELRAAGALLRETLEADGYVVSEPLKLEYLCYGKPYLEDRERYFSLSHSGDFVACIVDSKEVGIDIEKVRPVNPRIADRILNDQEKKVLETISEEYRDEELIRMWTRKESVAKCLGGGIFRNPKELPMDEFEIVTERHGDYYVSVATHL